jgi:threonylcarbamoyladenosine tRNA methylthiotransferase MtaB
MRVHLTALGCRLNEAELERWSRDFRARGHELAPGPGEADLVVVNTCAVTDEAVRKSRKLVRRARRANPAAKVILSGCYTALDPQRAAAELGVDVLVPNPEKDRLVEIVSRRLALPALPVALGAPAEAALFALGRQRAFVKVQDGCRHRCTFCVVTIARGDERSRPVAEVVSEIRGLHAAGVQEVVLTGVHLGGYGSDLGTDLRTLIGAVLADTRIARVRLGSLEPWDLPPGFWDLFADPRLTPHLHLPLQSGADTVLRRMARRCRTADFHALVAEARTAVPDINLTTDVIVGFPGETDAEWEQTLGFVAAIRFGDVHVFGYSPRPGTKAATLPDPVDEPTRQRRSQAMRGLAARLKREALEPLVGQRCAVLVEGERGTPDARGVRWEGYTPGYHRVAVVVPADLDLGNRIVDVRIGAVGTDGEHLVGELTA